MKKSIAFLVMYVLFAMQAYAVKITVGGVTYDDHGSSTIHEGLYRNVTVVGISSDFAGDLVIPALPAKVSNGLFYFRVTAINRYVFYENTKITSVTLPNTIETIGEGAFSNCSNLTEATIHGGVIGNGVFYQCTALSSVNIGEKVTGIGDYVFFECIALTRVEVAEESSAYSSSDGVLYDKGRHTLLHYPVGKPDRSFSIPGTVTALGESAFQSSLLSSVTIPESVTTIGVWAFGDCQNLTSISLSRNVTSISASAFNYCTGLAAIDVAAANTAYSSSGGVLYDKNKTIILRYPPNKADVSSYALPATVGEIVEYAFSDCLHLSSITMLGNVTTIGFGAFTRSKIKSVSLPRSVHFIDVYAFSTCMDLTDLTVFWNNPSEVATPTIEYETQDIFYGINKSAVRLHVPPGTEAAYRADALWRDFAIQGNATGVDPIASPLVALTLSPSGGSVTISGLQGNETLHFYNMNGNRLFSHKATAGTETISTAHLPVGVYFVRVNNRQTLKWLKK
jgi:hypothetical protein